jgi:biopolymer transport protein TolR
VIQIVIAKDETIEMKVNEKTTPITLKALASTVAQAQSGIANSAVVISADKIIKYESVVKVMDTLQKADIKRVGLSVQLSQD